MSLAQLLVEVGFVGGASTQSYLQLDDTVRGLLDTGTLGPDQVWTDVTEWVQSWSTRRGSSRVDGPVLRYDPGTLTLLLDNGDRRFDPTNLAGPYVSAGLTQVTPRRAVRVSAVWAGVTYPVFRGFVDAWKVAWDTGAGRGSTVTLTATDATKVLASHDGAALGAPVGAGELSGARVHRILDAAGWSQVDRVIAAGDTALAGTTLAASSWTDLLLTVDSELGELYVDASGRVVFRNRRAIWSEARSATSQVSLGDQVGDLPYEDLQIAYDDTQIVNLALIGRVGGVQQQAADVTSQQEYLTRTVNRTDLLMTTDAEALDYASFLVYQGKDPELRFDQVTLDPGTQDALWPHALGREFGDRVTIVRHPPGGGDPITRDYFVRGVTHTGSPDSWVTTWVLQSATRYQFLTLDHPTLSVLDANALAY